MENLKMIFVGDIMFNYKYLTFSHNLKKPTKYFRKIKKEFIDKDIVFGNLETCLFKGAEPIIPNSGELLYSNPKKVLSILKYLNFNILSLGNNHIDNFGEQALLKTKHLIEDNNIHSIGVGRNTKEARKPAIIDAKGKKIAFVNYTNGTNEDGVSASLGSAIAKENRAGCNYYNLKDIKNDIEELKGRVDKIIVSLHWGYEFFKFPSPGQKKLAHDIIDAGADLIIGHHPHCYQGIEEYKSKNIVYSLGNFFFFNYHSYNRPLYGNRFLLISCEVIHNDIKLNPLIGEINKKNDVRIVTNSTEYRKLKEISKRLYDENYKIFWKNYKTGQEKEIQKSIVLRKNEPSRIIRSLPRIISNMIKKTVRR